MRITADIIDEETSAVKENSENYKGANSNRPSIYPLTNFPTHLTWPVENILQQTQKVQEVTEKLRDLNLSDIYPSSSSQKNPTFPRFSTKPMEKQSDPSDPSKMENSPPVWLQQCMTKMKNDIKKELLEELLNMPSEFRQIQMSDIQSTKSGLIGKDENQLQYQGEVVHSGIYCDNCDQLIHGIRYKCGNCSDFDLCQECESLPNVHNKNHIFLKIRYPIALKLYQKQKWQELMTPLPIKPARFSDSGYSKNQTKKLYEAKFLCDETVPDSTVIPPSTRFVKSWKVMNSGTRVWTHATKLHLIQGSADLVPISQKVDVPHLKPGEEGIVSVLFTSPPLPGVYRSHWNFCHKSRPFGHIVWCHIIVKPMQEELKIDQHGISESSEKIMNKQVEVSSIAQVLTAVKHEEDNMVPRKLAVNSHTATPNNTPFALTPPKSPDHESLTKSVCEMAAEKNFLSQHNDSDDDDECSVVSISSSDSETEFVVIPMPKCFNLSESFVSQHIRLPTNLMETAGNVVMSNLEEAKETPCVKSTTRKSTPVSQETGVPELSEISCESILAVVENLADDQKTTRVSHTVSGCSSSEISIIESGNNSPTIENATQTFDSINLTLTTDASEVDSIEVHLNASSSVAEPSSSAEVTTYTTAIQEQTSDIPYSATFPKFPVEGVTGDIYERPSSNVNTEERTIQVLPEGLVIGALSAAASVYNTAKAVISTIQHPKAENGESLSQPLQRAPDAQGDNLANRSENLNPMDQLIEMGFCNRQQNEALLKKHKGDVALVVAELVSLSDNDWYASRHIPSSPPGFLD